jgi:CRP-like cAMP-binding protein
MNINSRAHINSLPPLLDILEEYNINHSTLRAYSGDVLYTEGMPISHAYLIKEGEVDIYMIREEKRVVVETLTAGHCFGILPKILLGDKRTDNARAKTYCEFYLINESDINALIRKTPFLIQSILKTNAYQIDRANDVISSRVNFQSDLIVFAELLHIVGMASVASQKSAAKAAQPLLAKASIKSIFGHARILLGQSDVHIRDTLGKFITNHLVQMEEDRVGGKCLVFSPKDIVTRARKLEAADASFERLEYEYISVDEFSAIVDLDRNSVLQTLARDEYTEDLFTFRKSEVLALLNEKGKKFFHERRKKSPEEFTDIADIVFADPTSLQASLAQVDISDLSKVLNNITDDAVKNQILTCLPRTRRNELELEDGEIDPVESALIGLKIINIVKEKILERRR